MTNKDRLRMIRLLRENSIYNPSTFKFVENGDIFYTEYDYERTYHAVVDDVILSHKPTRKEIEEAREYLSDNDDKLRKIEKLVYSELCKNYVDGRKARKIFKKIYDLISEAILEKL